MDGDWRDKLISDLREIGVVAEVCLGCRKSDCGCPAGSCTVIDTAMLSGTARRKLRKLYAARKVAR